MKTLLPFLGLELPALAQSISAQSLMNPLAFPSHDSPTISKIGIVGEIGIFRQSSAVISHLRIDYNAGRPHSHPTMFTGQL
jgi:hypothetical protein